MPIPLLVAGVGVGLSAVYNVGKAYDNARFWNDYYRRYHVRPKYPWRSGRFDHVNYLGRSLAPIGFASRYWNSGYYGSSRNWRNVYSYR